MDNQQRKAFDQWFDSELDPELNLTPGDKELCRHAWQAALSHAEGEAGWRSGYPEYDGDGGVCHIPLDGHPDFMVVAFNRDGTLVDSCGDDVGYSLENVERWKPIDAPTAPQVAVPELLVEMGRRMLADQKDNDHFTADPVFVVQRRRMVAGIDTDYDPEIGWLDEEGNLIEGEEREQLEAGYQESGNVPEGYTRTGVAWEWGYVDTYLTIEAARARINGGPDGRVYVESACRNHEMKAVREFLMSVAAPTAPAGKSDGGDICEQVELPHVLAWADGVRGDMRTEYADRITDEEARVAQAVWAARTGEQPVSDPDGLTEPGRREAEQAYINCAFDYARDPIGSRDWVLFWNGWRARNAAPAPDEREIAARALDEFRTGPLRSACLSYGWDTESDAYIVDRMLDEEAARIRAGKEGE